MIQFLAFEVRLISLGDSTDASNFPVMRDLGNAACCPEAFWGIVLEYSSVIELGEMQRYHAASCTSAVNNSAIGGPSARDTSRADSSSLPANYSINQR
ncbi:hypothetical protein C3L33_07966, partial [Rhododendron williamsianum]